MALLNNEYEGVFPEVVTLEVPVRIAGIGVARALTLPELDWLLIVVEDTDKVDEV